jgi:LysR family hydrogen peroxide-inducible transcriptional activator
MGAILMTLSQLEYVIAVADHKSFSRASEHCFVTQPTLSMQIQKLEEELGILIFDRSKKPVQPTPVGAMVIEQARANVQGLERIKEVVRTYTDEIEGHLHVGIIPTLAPYLLPLFITSFLEQYPRVTLSVEEMISSQIMLGLKQNRLDIGLLVTPLRDPALTEIPLFYEKFVAYVSTNHPLIHDETIDLQHLHIEEMLLLHEGHCFREQVVNICPDSGTHIWSGQLRFESGSLETLKRIVENRFGYTLLPELAVFGSSADKAIYIKKLNDPKPVREVSMVLHNTILKRRLIDAFRDSILDNLPDPVRNNQKENVVDWL